MGAKIRPGEDDAALDEAVDLLRSQQLVAFATETVYGLVCDATHAGAAAKVYALKGRPSTNPMIVHVHDAEAARACSQGWDSRCETLAERFWPGPLTLVLPKSKGIPLTVTGGQDTVALRSPAHPVARALLGRFGGPIAAPSANRSTRISPTRAEHVAADFPTGLTLILDGGPCPVGIESTVVDMTGDPVILRPGSIDADALSKALGARVTTRGAAGPARSPGLLPRHYAPTVPMRLYTGRPESNTAAILHRSELPEPAAHTRQLPDEPNGFARELYDALRWAEGTGAELILCETPPDDDAWSAIRDRLTRACHPHD